MFIKYKRVIITVNKKNIFLLYVEYVFWIARFSRQRVLYTIEKTAL